MISVAGIKFSPKGRKYYFNRKNFEIKDGDEVIVETERGLQYGFVQEAFKEIEETKLVSPLKDIIRIASKDDKQIYEKNLKDSSYALKKAKKIVTELENGDLNLDESIKEFEKGMELSKNASKYLEEAEKKITILVQDKDGELKEEEF